MGDKGLVFGGVTALAGRNVTRGVLLGVAEARGVPSLLKGQGVSCADVVEAERCAGTVVQEGDAVFIRSGIGQDKHWSSMASAGGRPGVLPEVIPWLYGRGVAVYSGDCTPTGLHQVPSSAVLVGRRPIAHTWCYWERDKPYCRLLI